VWWPRVEKKTNSATLSKLQRLAYRGIIDAIRTAPAAAVEVLLGSLFFV
jgi:glucose-6-phosphate dehydrogenase assembly protein OpcA